MHIDIMLHRSNVITAEKILGDTIEVHSETFGGRVTGIIPVDSYAGVESRAAL